MLFRELSPLLLRKLDADERAQLVELVEDVAKSAGGITEARREMIEEMKARLLPVRRAP